MSSISRVQGNTATVKARLRIKERFNMAYDEGLAQRLREFFVDDKSIAEKKMFGGIAFMLNGNMCCGVVNDTLMARVGAEQYSALLQLPHTREMDFTGRAMKGFIYVAATGIETDVALQEWVARCRAFVGTLAPK